MRLDRMTNKFQLAISDAQSLALGRDHQFIEPLHLMMALLNQDSGSIHPLSRECAALAFESRAGTLTSSRRYGRRCAIIPRFNTFIKSVR